ncbi:DUF1990 family protein [Pseudonocardia sp. T1-2H]|uniref:DUF1990 family protein n=1 Tax=Pseudonocardia sp. T1-2H TaxID=3128899 RepID=UPI00310119DE
MRMTHLLSRRQVTGTRRTRRVGALARWPVGFALVTWRYLWRTTPMHRAEEPGDASDAPPAIPAEFVDEKLQPPADGYGDLLHRRYTVRIKGAGTTPEGLMSRLQSDINRMVPTEIAIFRRTEGTPGSLTPGDEFLIRLPGPWDGPVRVIESDATRFRFATLRGHLEAGVIEFRTGTVDGRLAFSVESWARPGDRLSHVLYNRLRAAKEIQLNMWTEACLRSARLAGGRPDGGISVHTRRVADPAA